MRAWRMLAPRFLLRARSCPRWPRLPRFPVAALAATGHYRAPARRAARAHQTAGARANARANQEHAGDIVDLERRLPAFPRRRAVRPAQARGGALRRLPAL